MTRPFAASEQGQLALPSSRRTWLRQAGCGFGYLAAQALHAPHARAASSLPLAMPRAKRMIFLFMQGGVSQVDSWDHKPALRKFDGQMLDFADARVRAKTGKQQSTHRVMASPWTFHPRGQSGHAVSDLFPHMGNLVDRLCLIHSMHTEGVAHGPATLFLHCGATNSVRPSLGAWLMYGLGSENEQLPGFVSISPSMGNGGPRNFGAAFLPARCQATPIGRAGEPAAQLTIRHLTNDRWNRDAQQAPWELLQQLNQSQMARDPANDAWEAVINSYELAWQMQAVAPGLLDLRDETPESLALYGIGAGPTDDFGRKCLLARRLCEQGVRFVQVTYGDNSANPAWDQHANLPKHADHARAVDRPIAGLLIDLERRGLLEDTIVWWGGEFGRTPYAEQNGTGRDHNPGGFTMWLAGGGVRGGLAYGATDELGHLAVVDKVHLHDLHATLLHLMGLDHEQLTFRHAGRDFRLTDVHGQVVSGLLS